MSIVEKFHCGPVTIGRDPSGLPMVAAETAEGLFFGQGWAQARDRALQILLTRILGAGRAAEQLGGADELVGIDLFFRRRGWYADAAAEAAKLSGSARRLTAAFVAGVNARLEESIPWELRLAGYRHREPWSIADTIVLTRLMGYVGLQQSQGDLERFLVQMVRAGLARPLLDDLFPGLLGELDEPLLRALELSEEVVPSALFAASGLPRLSASNAWAVAGGGSGSGRTILASDPHLEVNRLPGIFLPMSLRWGTRWAVGATVPGLPGILAGRTPEVAWGTTYAFLDGVDSWVEECRGGACRRGDRFVPFDVRSETILRGKKPPLRLDVRENLHGVLDGDGERDGLRLATRCVGDRGTGARSIESVFALLEAPTAREAMAALARIESAWAFVVADADGHVGLQVSGLVPRRREGAGGFVPLPGWDERNDWLGIHPPESLPRRYDPPEGFVVAANQDLSPFGLATGAVTAPMSTYRADRIAARLREGTVTTLDDHRRLQYDVVSLQARRFLGPLRPLLGDSERDRRLADWDGSYPPDSRAATAFEAFYRELVLGTFAPLGERALAHVVDETALLADFHGFFDEVMLREGSPWLGGRPREEVWRGALERSRRVPDERWGNRNRIVLRHLLFGGRLPRVFGFDRGPFEIAGGRATPHQGQIFRSGGRETTFVAAFRMVTDLAEPWIEAVAAGGISDRRFSRGYAAGVRDWLAGRYGRIGSG